MKKEQLNVSWPGKKFMSVSDSPVRHSPWRKHSNSVMMRKHESSKDDLEFFPTPLWATRLFLSEFTNYRGNFKGQIVLEPCCGEGHMSEVLKEHFDEVESSDVFDYGYGDVKDFADYIPLEDEGDYEWDWMITNPPFSKGLDMVLHALPLVEGV